jgi:hypothetical protein
MEEYRVVGNEMGDLIDRSYIKPNNERVEITALKSIKSSFLNNIAISLSRMIMTANLIILGHTLYDNKEKSGLFLIFQIGIIIIEILGKFFITGLIKYLFEDKEDNNEFYVLYIRMKSSLVYLIPLFLGPICLCFPYLIMDLLLKFNLDIFNQTLIKELYYKFLIFSPVIFLFELLLLLNLHYLKYQKKMQEVFTYVLSFLVCHISLSCILVYILEMGLIGLTISYLVNTFIYYLFTNQYIKKSYEELSQNNFFLFPSTSNIDKEVFNLLKEKSILSIINLGDIIFLYCLFFMSLFTDKEQLIVNIIYLNFYELVVFINKGFYFSLKNYISTKIEEASKRQKYVLFFAFYFMILALILFILLILFKNILLDIYLGEGEKALVKICYHLRIFYPICILLNGIRIILNGMIRGMNIPLPMIKKILYIIVSIIISYAICFRYEFGILGLWISAFILNIFFILENIHKAVIFFPQFFNSYI